MLPFRRSTAAGGDRGVFPRAKARFACFSFAPRARLYGFIIRGALHHLKGANQGCGAAIRTHRRRRYHNPLNPKNPLNLLNPHARRACLLAPNIRKYTSLFFQRDFLIAGKGPGFSWTYTGSSTYRRSWMARKYRQKLSSGEGNEVSWKKYKKVYFRILLASFRIVYTLCRKGEEQSLREIRQK